MDNKYLENIVNRVFGKKNEKHFDEKQKQQLTTLYTKYIKYKTKYLKVSK